jgi:hypothetical protein
LLVFPLLLLPFTHLPHSPSLLYSITPTLHQIFCFFKKTLYPFFFSLVNRNNKPQKEVTTLTDYEWCAGYWWLLPLIMFVLCFLSMRGGCGCACGFSRWKKDKLTTIEEEKNHVLQ